MRRKPRSARRAAEVGRVVLLVGGALAGLSAAPGLAEDMAPDFLHVPTGQPLDLSPLPGETLTEAVREFRRTGRNPYRDDARAIAEGRALYREHCSFCHRYDGSGGNAPPVDGRSWIYGTTATDPGMFSVVYGGAFGVMRSWRRHGMTQAQVLRVIAYVRRLAVPGPLRAEARRAAEMAAGEAGVH